MSVSRARDEQDQLRIRQRNLDNKYRIYLNDGQVHVVSEKSESDENEDKLDKSEIRISVVVVFENDGDRCSDLDLLERVTKQISYHSKVVCVRQLDQHDDVGATI